MAQQYQYQAGGAAPYQYQVGGGLLSSAGEQPLLDPDKIWETTKEQSGTVRLTRAKGGDWGEYEYNLPKEALPGVGDSLLKEGIPAYYSDKELNKQENFIKDLEFQDVFQDVFQTGDRGELTGHTIDWTPENIGAFNELINQGSSLSDLFSANPGTYQGNFGSKVREDHNLSAIDPETLTQYLKDVEMYGEGSRELRKYKDFQNNLNYAGNFLRSASDVYKGRQTAIDNVGLGTLYVPSSDKIYGDLRKAFTEGEASFKENVFTSVEDTNAERSSRIQRAAAALRSL